MPHNIRLGSAEGKGRGEDPQRGLVLVGACQAVSCILRRTRSAVPQRKSRQALVERVGWVPESRV